MSAVELRTGALPPGPAVVFTGTGRFVVGVGGWNGGEELVGVGREDGGKVLFFWGGGGVWVGSFLCHLCRVSLSYILPPPTIPQLTHLGLEIDHLPSLKLLLAACPNLTTLSLGGRCSRGLTACEWARVFGWDETASRWVGRWIVPW